MSRPGCSGAALPLLFGIAIGDLMVSSTSSKNNLTIENAAAGAYSLKVMNIVAIVLFPIVLVYQGWSYYTFRHRIAGPPAATPEPAATGIR